MTITKSSRRTAMDQLVEIAQQVRNSSYFVKRGAVNWASFPFDKVGRALSISIDTQSLLEESFDNATVSLEMFGRIEEVSGDIVEVGIDDAFMDQIIDDARTIIRSWLRSTNSDGDCCIFMRGKPQITEAHDTTLMIQGIVVIIEVKF